MRKGRVQAIGLVIETRPDVVEGGPWGLWYSLRLLMLWRLVLRGGVLLAALLGVDLVGLVVKGLLLLRVRLLLVGPRLRMRSGLLVLKLLLVVRILLVRMRLL
ncbi:hypothetical protein ACH4FX_28740 [Streptomyces sp. NPDC018019]|uniref:hypothetical protein n=1 Tax=Streptomyces sp. NPDC018019 TaxID=3365030 RepID=UPI0037A86AFA